MDKPNLEIQTAFRAVFGTAQGIKVLGMLMDKADFLNYTNPDSTEFMAGMIEDRRSMILFIMEKIGLNDNESIARALLSIPVLAPEEDQIPEEEEI